MTTRSATCAADGFPPVANVCANRVSSGLGPGQAAGIYIPTRGSVALHIPPDRPSRARISRFTSSYCPAVTAGETEIHTLSLPVKRGAKARAQSAGSQPSMGRCNFQTSAKKALDVIVGSHFGSNLAACARRVRGWARVGRRFGELQARARSVLAGWRDVPQSAAGGC